MQSDIKSKERPILLNAEMVRAVLDGRKTQTRRIMSPQPSDDISTHVFPNKESQGWLSSLKHEHGPTTAHFCPFGAVGDRLWVRETFSGHYLDDDQIQDIKDGRDKASDLCEYRADYPNGAQAVEGWTPSIHMPRWASRITLEITGVRVERLASVSNEDAAKEGYPAAPAPYGGQMDHWLWFRQLWDGIYPEQSFKANPWVWVIEFKRVEGEHA